MRTSRHRSLFLFCLLPVGLSLLPGSLKASEANWSAELLKEVMEGSPAKRNATDARAKEEGYSLKTYQFQHLKVAEPGRAQDALRLLQKLLPEGSALRVDPAANSIHLLSSRSAHTAVWEFISTVDVESAAQSVQKNELSPILQELLQRLDSVQKDARRNAEQVERLQEDLKGRMERAAEEREHSNRHLIFWSVGLAGSGLLGLVWVLGRRQPKTEDKTKSRTGQGSGEEPSLELGRTQPFHDLLRQDSQQKQRELQNELMSSLNTAAIRMEAWYQDQQKHTEALAQASARQEQRWLETQAYLQQFQVEVCEKGLRRMEVAGDRLEQSQLKLESQVKELGSQHTRVELLADELKHTVKELDATRDEMLRLHQELEKKGLQLDHTQGRLIERERELSHQQAKLAALTLLLEDSPFEAPALHCQPGTEGSNGSHASTDERENQEGQKGQAANPGDAHKEASKGEPQAPETSSQPSVGSEAQETAETQSDECKIFYLNKLNTNDSSIPLFRLLPPDHPETA